MKESSRLHALARAVAAVAAAVASACGAGGGETTGNDDDGGVGPLLDTASPSDATVPGEGGAPDVATRDGATPTPACTGRSAAAGDTTISLTFGGLARTALVHVPPGLDPTRATPLVMAFHGFTDNAAAIKGVSHFDVLGDERGFLSVFPEGTNGSWNGGPCCGTAQATGVDDVGFAKALVTELAARYCVDLARVYAAGFSNGGFLAHRLGCEASEVFAAIGVVSGQEGMSTCGPTRPVPVLQIHGTADPVVPYGGNPLLGFPSTLSSVTGWAARDGCSSSPTEILRNGETHCDRYGGCRPDADVQLCTVDGGGHDWPRGGTDWDGGTPPAGFVASIYMLDFFAAHALR